MPSLFVLGATGYIGGAVLVTLLQEIPNIAATALVRNEEHVATLSGESYSSRVSTLTRKHPQPLVSPRL
jgi:uncharacterized protein YbjT (DUF2867 family)